MTKEEKAALEADIQQQRTIDNLNETASQYYEAKQAEKEARSDADKAMDKAIEEAPSIHKQAIANVVYQVRKLLKELENGGNKEEIIKKLKALNAVK